VVSRRTEDNDLMKYILLFIVGLIVVTPLSAQVTCRADASGPNWYFRGAAVIKDGKPIEVAQYVSGSGRATVGPDSDGFSDGEGEKKGWVRFDTVQRTSGVRSAITLFAPGVAEDEMVLSYRLRMKAGTELLAELDAESGGRQNGWPTGTTYILSANVSDPAKLTPIFRALDKAESITVETYAVFIDKSVSTGISSTFTVPAETLRNARAAAGEVRIKLDAAIRSGKCVN